jgi:phosphatidylglycerophosphate synthase
MIWRRAPAKPPECVAASTHEYAEERRPKDTSRAYTWAAPLYRQWPPARERSVLVMRPAPADTGDSTTRSAIPLLAPVLRTPWVVWLPVQAAGVAPVGVSLLVAALAGGAGGATVLRYGLGAIAALAVQNGYTWALRRRIGPERASPADAITHARGAVAAGLTGLVAAGYAGTPSAAGWLAFDLALLAATLLDWLDGPLARRAGPTRVGGALDIEADSWLTLWCAAGAVAWGGLPWWCLVPPVAHYLQPVYALRHGRLPAGGGPTWTRVTGVAQMTVLLGALLPLAVPWRIPALTIAAIPVSAAQLVAILASHWTMRKSVC